MAVLLAWQYVVSPMHGVLPTPTEVLGVIAGYWREPEFLRSFAASVRRVIVGYALGSSAGIVLGITMGLSRVVHALLDPLTQVLRPIAPIAWVPLAIVWFGLSEKATVFIIAYAAMFPVLVSTVVAVHSVNRAHVEAAETLGVRRAMIVREVIIPAALPEILVGLRIGMGLAWAVIVAAELTIGYTLQTGLGYIMLHYSQVVFNMPRVIVGILALGTLGFISDRLLRRVEDRLTPWRAGVRLR